jgi:hypothetical protein
VLSFVPLKGLDHVTPVTSKRQSPM